MGDWFIESGRLVGLCIHWLRESVSGGMEVPHRRKRRHRKHVHATGNKYCRASHVLLSTVRSWTLLLPHGRMVPGSAVPLTERLGQLKARPGTARFEQRRRTGQPSTRMLITASSISRTASRQPCTRSVPASVISAAETYALPL